MRGGGEEMWNVFLEFWNHWFLKERSNMGALVGAALCWIRLTTLEFLERGC